MTNSSQLSRQRLPSFSHRRHYSSSYGISHKQVLSGHLLLGRPFHLVALEVTFTSGSLLSRKTIHPLSRSLSPLSPLAQANSTSMSKAHRRAKPLALYRRRCAHPLPLAPHWIHSRTTPQLCRSSPPRPCPHRSRPTPWSDCICSTMGRKPRYFYLHPSGSCP